MNAKEVVNKKINEDDYAPSERRRVREIGISSRPPRDDSDPENDIRRAMGHSETPRGQFTPKETGMIKDIVIQMLAKIIGGDDDANIGKALMSGQPLDAGQLHHIYDEGKRLELPPSHKDLLNKLTTRHAQV